MSAHGTYHGNITATGGENCDYRGFVWDTSSHGDPGNVAPASSGYASNWTESGSFDTGAFSHQVTGLAENVPFYVRACAHNSAGWSYGGEVSFTTPQYHYAAATLAGSGSLAGIGRLIAIGKATLSGSGTLAAIGAFIRYGRATLSGAGTLAAIGQVFKLGAASLSGAGNLTTSAVAIFAGKATLAGAGSLAAFGRSILAGAATLSGQGSLTASAMVLLFGKATLSGVGTLSAQGIRIVTGIASLAGVGLLSAAARVFGLMATLEAAQKKPDRLPYVEAKVYDFEQGIKRLPWTRLYEGSEPDNHHGIALDGQGAMHRIRADTGWAEGKLIGEDDETSENTVFQDYIWADKFTASVTGVMDQFRIKVDGSGNVKVAVYADDAGEPGALLNAVNAGQAVTAGWNTISFPSTQLTSGTDYWLAFITDVRITCRYTSAGKVKRYKVQAYAGYSFEDPAPDMSNMDGYPDIIAGWRAATPDNLLYRQKVSSPDAESDYTQWTLITDNCHGPCAIAASGSKIYIFYRKGDNTVRKYYSHNYGVDWTDAELSTCADVLSMAAAWWAAGDIVVCFCAKATELNAIVLNSSTQAANEYTHSEPSNHPLLNTYGIGAAYETDHMAIIFAGKEDASPYDFYALYRTQLSSAYNWLAWEYFITSPDGEDITFEYPDCHIPSSPQDYEQVQIAAVEKFAGSTAVSMPLICHSVRGSTFQEMAYTEPRPFLNISSTYGLRFASTASYWWLERPDGVWQAPRAAGDPTDLSADIISLTQRVGEGLVPSLTIVLDNSNGQHATPPKKRSEVVLKLGYKTTEGDLALEVGRYWIDGWEWTSGPGLSTFKLFALDGHGLSRKWSARYQMRWNQSAVSPRPYRRSWRPFFAAGAFITTTQASRAATPWTTSTPTSSSSRAQREMPLYAGFCL